MTCVLTEGELFLRPPLITISLNAFSIFYGCLASLTKLMFQKCNNLKPDKISVLGIAPEFFTKKITNYIWPPFCQDKDQRYQSQSSLNLKPVLSVKNIHLCSPSLPGPKYIFASESPHVIFLETF